MRTPLCLGTALLLLCPSWQLRAQAAANTLGTVRLETERRVGYMLGDLIAYDAVVTVDRSWRLRDSSLPTPGHSEYWLELRRVSVDQTQARLARIYRIHLLYQTFYAPIEARTRVIPGFALTFEQGATTHSLAVPPLTITMSPLREVASGTGDPEENVKPNADRAPAPESLRQALLTLALSVMIVFVGLLGLAWQRGLWPFASTPRPFGRLARWLARQRGRDADSYAGAMQAMHRAFDATAGWRVFAEDQGRFLAQQPGFRGADQEITGFFAASRVLFFGNNAQRASDAFPLDRLRHLARRLARLERGQ